MFWILVVILPIGILALVFMAICDIFYLYPRKNCTKLPYNQFIDYYWVNPDKWDLYPNYVEYKIYNEYFCYLSNHRSCTYERFTFSYIDVVKYRLFKYKIRTQKAKNVRANRDSEAYKNLLTNVQKDIDKLRKQSENELNQAMNTMKEVKERIG